jgi:ribonucleoside-triphosphate reductase (formate)
MSILHANLDTMFDSFDKAWYMLNWIASQDITYFAFNGKISQCKNYHSFYGDKCPICGEIPAHTYTRTVGFYTDIGGWSAPRKEEEKMREWH